MNKSLAAILTITCIFISSSAFAASVQKAQMLNEHGLRKEAKKELIDVIYSKSFIEHLYYPERYLEEAFRVIDPDYIS